MVGYRQHTTSLFYRLSSNSGTSFGSAKTLSKPVLHPGRIPRWGLETIAAKGDYVYVVFVEDGTSRVLFRSSSDGGTTFGSLKELTKEGYKHIAGGWWPVMVADPADATGATVHVFWTGPRYVVSTNGGDSFTTPVLVASNFTLSSYNRPQMAVGTDGIIHFTGEGINRAGYDSDIFYRRLQTGISKIDEFMSGGFLPGSSFTLAASPGTGKTTLMLQILENLAKNGYKVGYISGEENITEADIERLQATDDAERAREKALQFLSSRPRSEWEVRQNLRKAGYEDETVDRALERLRGVGLVDDAAFVRYWIDNRRQFKPKGEVALRQELRRKGVDREVIDIVLEESGHAEDQAAIQAALAKADRYRQLPRPEFAQKLGAYLARCGFDYETVREAVQAAWQAVHADEPSLTLTH